MKAGDHVSKAQVEDLGAKLEKFAQGLPKEEKDVLGWILSRASAASNQLSDEDLDKVAGGLSLGSNMLFQRPTSQLIGSALGFGGGQVSTIGIRGSWSW
jgi:hypothetical protein